MAGAENTQSSKVNVEDLLRIKRAERPDDVFWDTFDKELHQRMLRTLVKKDPWYAQILRGLSGRLAQTIAVGSAAAVVALMVFGPVLDEPVAQMSASYADLGPTSTQFPLSVEVSMADLDSAATADYQIEAISIIASTDAAYAQDYALDGIELTSYDREAYAMDSATFAAPSLAAGLVY